MLCQQCKKNPVAVNYIESTFGNKVEFHLCAECYAELVGEYKNKSNNSIFAGLFSSAKSNTKSCPVCGTTYADYEKTGLLGCAGCYDVFKDELIPSIQRIQGKVEHVGKSGGNTDALGLHRRLKALQEQLEEALREKRFGEADRLYRQINAIKKTLHGGGLNG